MTEFSKISRKEAIEKAEIPACYTNYCQTHETCKKCIVKDSCLKITPPKEPDWCNPD